ncbi:MAG: serine--pyruvate aminotransferase [Firmicutes bacterium HGW-Firmicutes-12]|jgi:short-chain fatty acids transporter|nr:MAG: serine--pyruvate aminotransferase [Firmicutes bacterium HGW-Firmicutes-12]
MLWRLAKRFQFAADRFIPSSFVFCIVLTLIVFLLGIILTGAGPFDLVKYWYGGLWSIMVFTLQIILVLVFASAAARAPQFEKMLSKLAKLPKSPAIATAMLFIFTAAVGWVNWAFGVILAPIFAMQIVKNVKGCHFPLLIATSYSAMILVQPICPSTSAVTAVATKGHFLESIVGVIPASQTAFNPVNLVIVLSLVVLTCIISALMHPSPEEAVEYVEDRKNEAAATELITELKDKSLAYRFNNSRIILGLVTLAELSYLIYHFYTKGPIFDFYIVILSFMALAMLLYKTPDRFMIAIQDSITTAAPIVIQYPFYGGIMGMMASSGLSAIMATKLIEIASPVTLPFWSYISAAVVNIFVPSQGGQWVIQGPILMKAAQALNVDYGLIVSAFMLGDEATNLINPLFVLPALALVNLEIKHIWGFMAFICLIWMIVTSIGLLVLPGILM